MELRIGVVGPSARFSPEAADRVNALVAAYFPEVEIFFHPQCFLVHNHFAGTDAERLEALVETANDPALDAIWFARGGYGACRIAEDAIARFDAAARAKTWLGYSDGGYLLAGLYKAGFANLVHGPIPQDVMRAGGDAAVLRSLSWLTKRDPASLEPGLERGAKHVAFNITVLGLLLGTPLEPDLKDHVVLIEDVSEHAYRTDRAMFHLTGNANIRNVAGIRLGRVIDVPQNDPDFGESAEEIVQLWCGRAGIPYLGRADIGHDVGNKLVPFGPF